MVTKKMADAINEQMIREIYSAYLYMSMSAFSSDMGLKGFANWLMVQYHEEMYHGMKMYEYLQSQGVAPRIKKIDEPPAEWSTPLDMFQEVLKHERKVTAWINELMDIAHEEKDYASQIFIQWYVTEQIEEEENANDIISRIELTKESPQALMMLDKELEARIVKIPIDFSKGLSAAESQN